MDEHTRTWVSVDEAFVLCQQAGLNRTKKTIRTWARKDHVDAEKQITPTGEQWMLDSASLDVKIKAELEFQARAEIGTNYRHPSAPPSERVQTTNDPVRTSSDAFEPAPISAGTSKMEAEIESLRFDKATRDAKIEFLTQQNREWQQAMMGQSRYIGHLETKLVRLGGQADQTFLEAPVPERPIEPEIVNPNQPDLGVG